MPTEGPRRKIEPERVSLDEFWIEAWILRKPTRECENRVKDSIFMDLRAYGEELESVEDEGQWFCFERDVVKRTSHDYRKGSSG